MQGIATQIAIFKRLALHRKGVSERLSGTADHRAAIPAGFLPAGVGYIVERMNNRLRMANAVGRCLRCVVMVTSFCLMVSAAAVESQAQANPASATPSAAMPGAVPPTPSPSVSTQSQPVEASTPSPRVRRNRKIHLLGRLCQAKPLS